MGNFRFNYRADVIIQADTEEEANEVWENLDLQDLSNEMHEDNNSNVISASFIELIDIEKMEETSNA